MPLLDSEAYSVDLTCSIMSSKLSTSVSIHPDATVALVMLQYRQRLLLNNSIV